MVLDEEQSCVQRLAQNRWFERAALLLTLSNVIYISLDVEFNYSGLASESSTGFIEAWSNRGGLGSSFIYI